MRWLEYFQVSPFPSKAAGCSSSSTLKHNSPARLETQAMVLANTIKAGSRDPSELSMTVYLSGSYLDLKKKYLQERGRVLSSMGKQTQMEKKRALIRTVSVLYAAFHPRISKCFNMTVLSLLQCGKPEETAR